jgi:type I restriction enzyme, R subunit
MELGIKYSQMPEEQRQQLEEQEVEPDKIEYEPSQINKAVFNKDTNRHVLRNLMENGIKIKDGTQLGKTIVFARNHNHALLLQSLFNELYPQYGGKFCSVIDNYDPRADELIDDFKDPDKPLTIAISVDMLDTGIDVPDVVNLVFAKPVYSYVKFWQMLGRGTRLRENLFGPGKHKTHFMVFDHWKVFEFFDYHYQPSEPTIGKSLLQRLFESRIGLADVALRKPDLAAFDIAIKLLGKDIADLPESTISVREKWKQVQVVKNEHMLRQFEPATRAVLLQDIAPLMQWRDADGNVPAFSFDNLIAKMQVELLRQSGKFNDLKDELLNLNDQLQSHLNPVKAREQIRAALRTQAFWDSVSVASLEDVREQMRGIMRYRLVPSSSKLPPKIVDVKEDESGVMRKEYKPKLEGLELAAYRKRVEQVLHNLFDSNATLKRIKAGQPVTEDDLTALNSLVLTQHPDLDLSDLTEYYPETAGHLDLAIRSIIGLDAKEVSERFEKFVQKHPTMNSRQIKFLDLLQNYISKYGRIEIGRLYEDPFTSLHSDGPDGLFQEPGQLDELLSLLETFSPSDSDGKDQTPA